MSSVYRFGDLILDVGRQELRRGEEPIHLGPLSYRLLLALIEAAPDVASHHALADAVWTGRPVSPETISQRAKMLRAALGDDVHAPRYIELLRGRGYRLIPAVVPASTEKPAKRPALRAIAMGAALGLAAAALIWRLSGPEPGPQPSLSIAVLPFADMSPGQDQEYFADGIAEEILNLLSSTTPLKVIARASSFSFKGKNADIATIADKLNVSHVLEGSVRKSDTRIRVAVQLVAAADEVHVWSDTYDSEIGDVLSLQADIAASVAAALEVNLLGDDRGVRALTKRVIPEAFDAYLLGQEQLRIHSKSSFAEAERYFEQSIEIDPSFLPAYRSLGLVYVLRIVDVQIPVSETVAKLRVIVRQGLEFDPKDAGLVALSGQLARYDGNNERAERQLRRGLELDSSSIPVLTLYATFKLDQGQPRKALSVVHRILELDPLNPSVYIQLWACHMDLWNAPEAIAAALHYDDVSPVSSPNGFGLRGMSRLLLLGDVAGGARDIARAMDIATEGASQAHAPPSLYYDLGDIRKGDAALEIGRQILGPDDPGVIFGMVYRHLVTEKVDKARELALQVLTAREDYSALYDDNVFARLAIDALIAGGEPNRAIELIDRMAPVYATYRSRPHIQPREFSPAPYAVKGTYSSYPALYFPDYIRALRAAGDAVGADNMLGHLEAILQLRRERGLFIEERHVAEARALRGDLEGALDALEQGERDGTIYFSWHVFLLHNEIFAGIRHHPRFEALMDRVTEEMRRQRAQLVGT